MEFDVLVEIPKGERNKYEVDHQVGRIRLDRTLFTSTAYPADYGFIEDTLGQDGDPLDALVILQQPTFPGCLIALPCDRHVPDDRRGRRRRQGAVRPRPTTRGSSTSATSTTSRSSTGSRSSTSSRSTRTSSPASPSRAPTGSAAPRPRKRSRRPSSASRSTRKRSRSRTTRRRRPAAAPPADLRQRRISTARRGQHADHGRDHQQEHLVRRQGRRELVVADPAVEEPGDHADEAGHREQARQRQRPVARRTSPRRT